MGSSRTLVVLCAAFAGMRAFAVLSAGGPEIFPDTPTYSALDLLGGAPRTWTVPLLWGLVGGGEGARLALHLAVGIVAWCGLAVSAERAVERPPLKIALPVGILLLGLTTPVTQWDATLLSESLALSGMVALLAIGLVLLRDPSRGWIAGFLAVLVLVLFTRHVNLLAFLVGLPFLLFAVRRERAVAVALVLLGAWSAVVLAREDRIWRVNAAYMVEFRLAPEPERYEWFLARGLPTEALPALRRADGGRGPLARTPLGRWVDREWRSAYLRYTLTHPRYAVVDAAAGAVAGAFDVERNYSHPPSVLTRPVDRVIWPRSWPVLLVLVAVALILAGLEARRRPSLDRRERIAAALVVGGFGLGMLTWHGSATEPGRLQVPPGLAMLLGAQLLVGFRLDRRPGAGEDDYERWIREEEPELMAVPRVHLFAQPPVTAGADLPAADVHVWIDRSGGGDAGATLRSLGRQLPREAARVDDGTPEEALSALPADGLLVVVHAGDVLAPRALQRIGQAARLAPGTRLITCDEDRLDSRERRRDPRLRPGPSPDRVLARDDPGALVAVCAPAPELGRPGWRHELARTGPTAHVPLILVHRDGPVRAAPTASARPRYDHPGRPHVQIVVVSASPALAERCTASVQQRTTYDRYSIEVVDGGAAPFNYARLNNEAVARGAGELVVLLNDDTEVITPAWLEELMEHARRPEVGAVGPLLEFPDGRVQHAGVVIGLDGFAGHPWQGLGPDDPTPFGAAAEGPRNWLAVTGACLMVERAKWDEVGGMDEAFALAGNDVDLGVRLTARGHRSLCLPHVRLRHAESATRDGDAPGDEAAARAAFGRYLEAGDPFYHPGLALERTDCSLRRTN